MQRLRDSLLRHVTARHAALSSYSTNGDARAVSDRVLALVKRFDKVDSSKVTETADFRKDMSLDSLDKVELIMVFEEEFSIEIPDDKADAFACCADVARYISSQKVPSP